jgi:tetratricopeptide (TPR) repeat protein
MNIQNVEISLLTGTWSSPAVDETASLTPIIDLVRAVCDGNFSQVLASSHAREFFRISGSVQTHLEKEKSPYSSDFDVSALLGARVVDADARASAEVDYELLRLVLAVTCLNSFVQANWTGPDLNIKPSDVLDLAAYNKIHSIVITEEDLNARAIAELAHGGEPAYHLSQYAAFLRMAQILFSLPYQHCQSIPWWILRVNLIHQQVLDEPSIVSEDVRTALIPLFSTIARDRDLSGRLLLEQGLLEHTFSRDRIAADIFVKAARATGLNYELTGALGRRTKFQETDLSQLVLLAESRKRDTKPEAEIDTPSSISLSSLSKTIMPETLPLNDDTLLEKTEFTSSVPSVSSHLSHIDPSSQPSLDPLDQCILLSMCLNVRNTSPVHGLTTEQMAPYVDRVISHPQNWSIHSMALLLRTRLESTRTRTIDRSTLQLQALVDQMPTSDSSVRERLLYFHAIPLPSKWDLERELALRFASLGVVKSALEIFERLEMWEEVIQCWQSMERKDRAITIVNDLLKGRKREIDFVLSLGRERITEAKRRILDSAREAKLWCILGDLEPENAEQHYQYAWEISKQTSARAMRSLGGYYFARGDYGQAIASLRNAVRINPLLSRSWFLLGCACVREEDWQGARDAFSRCVAIDEEDGESWSNLASTYLRIGDTQGSTNSDSTQSNVGQQLFLLDPQTNTQSYCNRKTGSTEIKNRITLDLFRSLTNYWRSEH